MYRVLLVEDEEIELETLRDYIDWKKLHCNFWMDLYFLIP